MADIGICESGCFYKNKADNSCKVRFKEGMELARRTDSCELFNDTKTRNPYQTKYNTKQCKK